MSGWKKKLRYILFPVKAVTFVWRFAALLVCTAYLEGGRVVKD
jgi:hypothetical protein